MQGLILINKDKGKTSHDVVSIARNKLRIKRIGHTGTLDPNATGLLVLAIGNSTKLVPYLQKADKEYVFEIQLGLLTDTEDIWGKVIETQPINVITKEDIEKVFKESIGHQQQIPPMYSAIKKDGKKLYELARNGETIEREAREIEITELELLDFSEDIIKGRVVCSSGTYVRTLCVDLAQKLNNIGVMKSLKRTCVGVFTLDDADVIDNIDLRSLTKVNVLDALKEYEQIEYQNDRDIYNGKRITVEAESDLVLIVKDKRPLAFYEREKDDTFKSKRGLW